MRRRVLMILAVLAVLGAGLWWSFATDSQATPAPKPKTVKAMNTMAKRITRQDREAAAARAAKERASASSGGKVSTAAVPTPGGTPDYFGTTPNFANSQLPASIGILGDGTGANAVATVDPTTGAITAIQVTAGGANYTQAATTVRIIGGGGSGATATAVVTSGAITAITVNQGGTGYNTDPGIRKFVDTLPGLGAAGANDLGQYIPVAVPDTTTYPGCDYYEISLVQFTEKMHADLPATTLRGYEQTNTTDISVSKPSLLGPIIVAHKGTPVRIKFTNALPTGAGGNLFLPVDTTVMGAGAGPLGLNVPAGTPVNYTQNRATLHLHGGDTPWISDGTPHQWTTPAGEATAYPKGVSVQYVPDMYFVNGKPVAAGTPGGSTNPGPGQLTFYYTNNQSARLMFYHDHSYGITRLNVYAGEAAGYILRDSGENTLVAGGTLPKPGGGTLTVAANTVPSTELPLVIQDKTFVPDANSLAVQDPTWNYGGRGSLWLPHVYMTNQNPSDPSGMNAMGRWDYNLWFYPPITGQVHGTVANPYASVSAPWEPAQIPGTPNPSLVPESFMDTPVINGTAYPVLKVGQKAYRLRILNACDDRYLNLQLYYVKNNSAPMWNPDGTLNNANAGEVNMVPAAVGTGLPATWPTDGRNGGVPDPTAVGPSFIQIGNEGGFLPNPDVIAPQPVTYEQFRRTITVLNVKDKSLYLGPAERADVVVDFSQVPNGSTLVLYNDAPAPMPAFDERYDYYTGDPDQTSTGGAPSTLPGYGPDTRTLMQIQVDNTLSGGTAAPAYDLAALQTALPAAFAAGQPTPIVPEAAYNNAYAKTYTNNYFAVADTSLTFTPIGQTAPVTLGFGDKAIIEGFELNYGRMNAQLGGTLTNIGPAGPGAVPYAYVDPPTDLISATPTGTQIGQLGDGTQIWRIDHQGVDTHAIHFHLFNVQVINRVALDGQVFPPDANEVGWKETIRMNPGQDVVIAMRPIMPKLPFGVPDSVRSPDPTSPPTATWTIAAPPAAPGGPVISSTVINTPINFGWEYVWHCHLLGHEENDMMRPVVFSTPRSLPAAPVLTAVRGTGTNVNLTWTDGTPFNYTTGLPTSTLGNPANEVGFNVERAVGTGPFVALGSGPANSTALTDATADPALSYRYRVTAWNAAGNSVSNIFSLNSSTTLTKIEQTNTSIVYSPAVPSATGLWRTFVSASASGGSYARTTSTTAYVVIPFNGTALNVIATKGTTMGKADFSVDGGAVTTVDLSATAAAYQQTVFSTGTLAAGYHWVKISKNTTSTAAQYVNLDAVQVAGTLVAVSRNEQTLSNFVYVPNPWTTFASASASGGSYARTTTAAATVTIKFNGMKFDYITTKGTTLGLVDVYLDGVLKTTVNLYNAAGALYQQNVWTTGWIVPGVHTVQFKRNTTNVATRYIAIDRGDVWGVLQ